MTEHNFHLGCNGLHDSTGTSGAAGRAGRISQPPPRNYWPDHDQSPLTNFVSERHRAAVMWKL